MPVRSRETRRIRVRLSASGDGVRPSCASLREDEVIDRVLRPRWVGNGGRAGVGEG